jgi:hypothetical protein
MSWWFSADFLTDALLYTGTTYAGVHFCHYDTEEKRANMTRRRPKEFPTSRVAHSPCSLKGFQRIGQDRSRFEIALSILLEGSAKRRYSSSKNAVLSGFSLFS